MIYRHTHTDGSREEIPSFGVNKQFNEELSYVLENQRKFCYRISSQEANFDGLALACFRILKRHRSFDEIQDLTVEIYPPHPDRPIDMLHIWKRVKKFYDDLRAASVIPRLSLHFIEDEIAA